MKQYFQQAWTKQRSLYSQGSKGEQGGAMQGMHGRLWHAFFSPVNLEAGTLNMYCPLTGLQSHCWGSFDCSVPDRLWHQRQWRNLWNTRYPELRSTLMVILQFPFPNKEPCRLVFSWKEKLHSELTENFSTSQPSTNFQAFSKKEKSVCQHSPQRWSMWKNQKIIRSPALCHMWVQGGGGLGVGDVTFLSYLNLRH